MSNEAKKVRLRQVGSAIGATEIQRRTLRALGLRKRGAQREHTLSPAVKGMVDRVKFLLEIEEI